MNSTPTSRSPSVNRSPNRRTIDCREVVFATVFLSFALLVNFWVFSAASMHPIHRYAQHRPLLLKIVELYPEEMKMLWNVDPEAFTTVYQFSEGMISNVWSDVQNEVLSAFTEIQPLLQCVSNLPRRTPQSQSTIDQISALFTFYESVVSECGASADRLRDLLPFTKFRMEEKMQNIVERLQHFDAFARTKFAHLFKLMDDFRNCHYKMLRKAQFENRPPPPDSEEARKLAYHIRIQHQVFLLCATSDPVTGKLRFRHIEGGYWRPTIDQ